MTPPGSWHPLRTTLTVVPCVLTMVLGFVFSPLNIGSLLAGPTGLLCAMGAWRSRHRSQGWPALLALCGAVLASTSAAYEAFFIETGQDEVFSLSGWPFYTAFAVLILAGCLVLRTWWVHLLIAIPGLALTGLALVVVALSSNPSVRVPPEFLAPGALGLAHLVTAWRRRRSRGTFPPPGPGQLLIAVLVFSTLLWWWASPVARVQAYDRLGLRNVARQQCKHLPHTPHADALRMEIVLREQPPVQAAFAQELESWPWFSCGSDFAAPPGWSGEIPRAYEAVFVEGNECGALAMVIATRACGEDAMLVPRGWEQGIPEGYAGSWQVEGHSPEQEWPRGAICPPRIVAMAGAELQRPRIGPGEGRLRTGNRQLALAYRLGHLGWKRRPSDEVVCITCGPITGPAPGVTEHQDGSLTWRREDGPEVTVPPVSWMPGTWQSPAPRPTMAPIEERPAPR